MSDTENNQNIENEEKTAEVQEVTPELEIEQLKAEIEQHKDDALRARAELDNFRRRTIRDKQEFQKVALIGIVEELLPVLDNFQLGLKADSQSPEETIKGFSLILDHFKSILRENGLEELNPLGEPFDPNKHECVSLLPSEEVEQNNVIDVARIGYALNGRLLRPANVVVSSGASEKEGS